MKTLTSIITAILITTTTAQAEQGFTIGTSLESWKTNLEVTSGSVTFGGKTQNYTETHLKSINSSQVYQTKQKRALGSVGYTFDIRNAELTISGIYGRSNTRSSLTSGNINMYAGDGGNTYGTKISIDDVEIRNGFYGEGSLTYLIDKQTNLRLNHPVDPSATKDLETTNLVATAGIGYNLTERLSLSGGLMYHDLEAKEIMYAGGTQRNWNLSNPDKFGFYTRLGCKLGKKNNAQIVLSYGKTGSSEMARAAAKITF